MYNNTYIQKLGMTMGQYGAKENKVPEVIAFFEDADEKIKEIMKETDANVYYIK